MNMAELLLLFSFCSSQGCILHPILSFDSQSNKWLTWKYYYIFMVKGIVLGGPRGYKYCTGAETFPNCEGYY